MMEIDVVAFTVGSMYSKDVVRFSLFSALLRPFNVFIQSFPDRLRPFTILVLQKALRK